MAELLRRSINNLAGLLDSQGRLEEAEPLCRSALQGSENNLGGHHPQTLASINNLAVLLRARGRVEGRPAAPHAG